MYPFADVPLRYIATREVIINMVTAFGPCVVCFFDLDGFLAKAAPEMGITMTASSTCVDLFFQFTLVRDFMLFRKMASEALAAVADLVTKLATRVGAIAYPYLELVVLDTLMSLPVVLASKCLVAVQKSTPVRF
jgi:hypothetical protein